MLNIDSKEYVRLYAVSATVFALYNPYRSEPATSDCDIFDK